MLILKSSIKLWIFGGSITAALRGCAQMSHAELGGVRKLRNTINGWVGGQGFVLRVTEPC